MKFEFTAGWGHVWLTSFIPWSWSKMVGLTLKWVILMSIASVFKKNESLHRKNWCFVRVWVSAHLPSRTMVSVSWDWSPAGMDAAGCDHGAQLPCTHGVADCSGEGGRVQGGYTEATGGELHFVVRRWSRLCFSAWIMINAMCRLHTWNL